MSLQSALSSLYLGTTDITDDLTTLVQEHAVWSRATFGSDGVRGPQGPLKHLAREIDEILEDPSDELEWADGLLLFLDGMRRAGFRLNDVVQAAQKKLEINKTRTWPTPPDNDNPVFHDKE